MKCSVFSDPVCLCSTMLRHSSSLPQLSPSLPPDLLGLQTFFTFSTILVQLAP